MFTGLAGSTTDPAGYASGGGHPPITAGGGGALSLVQKDGPCLSAVSGTALCGRNGTECQQTARGTKSMLSEQDKTLNSSFK